MYNDNSGGKAIKFVLIIIIIGLVIYLLNRGEKITKFKMNETVKIGDLELCFNSAKTTSKLKPANAPDDYGYFESADPNKTILDISGTIKNTTTNKIALKDAINSSIIIEKTKYSGNKKYENKQETDYLEENNAFIEPSQTLKIHYLLIANKSILKNGTQVEVIIDVDGEKYSMTVTI